MVVIDCLEKRAGRYEFIAPIIKRAESKEVMIVVSTFAQTETQRINGYTDADSERIIEEFFDREWVHPEAPIQAICKLAGKLARDHNMATVDATHVATAAFTNCRVFLTNDGVAKKKKQPLLPLDGQILCADGTPLRIMTPSLYHTNGLGPLFIQDKNGAKKSQEETSIE